jgi:hypothetical protein
MPFFIASVFNRFHAVRETQFSERLDGVLLLMTNTFVQCHEFV